jgi:hypothetical protein
MYERVKAGTRRPIAIRVYIEMRVSVVSNFSQSGKAYPLALVGDLAKTGVCRQGQSPYASRCTLDTRSTNCHGQPYGGEEAALSNLLKLSTHDLHWVLYGKTRSVCTRDHYMLSSGSWEINVSSLSVGYPESDAHERREVSYGRRKCLSAP